MSDLQYDPVLNRITGIDNGNCRVLRGVPHGADAEEVWRLGRLFAAAEDLSEACELLLAYVELVTFALGSGAPALDGAKVAIDAGRAAITRTGRSS